MMKNGFEMSMMGELNFFLGLQIKQCKDGIFITQSKYVKELTKKIKMTEAKVTEIPMSATFKFEKDEKGKFVDCKLYRGMIGSLLCLTAIRPDIHFSVCVCARFQADPKESHIIAVKRILRYLLSTQDLGLWYPRNISFDLVGYCDADFASSKTDKKNTSGACQFLGHALISWFSKKQTSVALSTAEAEYIAAGSCVAQIIWMKQELEDYNLRYTKIPIMCDKTSAINLTKNPIMHSRTKHTEIRHHFIRDHVQANDIELIFVPTEIQLVDLNEETFCRILVQSSISPSVSKRATCSTTKFETSKISPGEIGSKDKPDNYLHNLFSMAFSAISLFILTDLTLNLLLSR
ncbi:uncharacterized mitochondrial protein AtMg00810-like [Mercurialis annua]|uniref:uncharacterized mitochondrial protein AtMg00810-like n=1 Tax=Mercurialis annua TaxID=3986 RepID=UPI00215F22F9|nr:uncharacterized mitochondrial protein AtMg00810-like [Mercurialis annua]